MLAIRHTGLGLYKIVQALITLLDSDVYIVITGYGYK